MKKLFRLLCRLVVLACIAAVILVTLPPLARKADQLLYPRKYSQQVEQWAAEYDPAVSIRFGCYYLHLCMERYGGDVATAAAAYHSGWGTVDNLLRMEEHSSDGQTLKGFPYNQMHHYVEKITAGYAAYTRLYGG